MDSRQENGPARRHGGPNGELSDLATRSVLVIGRSAATSWLDASTLEGISGIAEVPSGAIYEDHHIAQLADAGAVVLVPKADALSHEDRRVCLLALHVTGELPIIAASDPSLAQEVLAYATALSAPAPTMATNAAGLSAAIGTTLRRKALAAAGAPFRMEVTAGDGGQTDTITGQIVAGAAEPGLEVVVLPSAASAVVRGVAVGPDDEQTVQLDRAIPAARGHVLASSAQRPECADQVASHIVWMADQPLLPGRPYTVRLAGQWATAQISTLKHKINPETLDPIAARQLERGEIALCNLSFDAPLAFDQPSPARPGLPTGRFVLEETGTGRAVGIGTILFALRRATNIHWQQLSIDKTVRSQLKGQRPCCLWFTGLSGSGKSTVASLLEKRLSAIGRHTYTLDGDNVRHGLNRDLGFTDADRVENIRRIAEVSKLFVDAGLIVMVSFISPFRAERRMARALFQPGEFLEIYLDTPIDVCESRDPKGLYKKARAGALRNFTGIDSPYEAPEQAEIRLDSGTLWPETLVEQVLRELTRRGTIDLAQ